MTEENKNTAADAFRTMIRKMIIWSDDAGWAHHDNVIHHEFVYTSREDGPLWPHNYRVIVSDHGHDETLSVMIVRLGPDVLSPRATWLRGDLSSFRVSGDVAVAVYEDVKGAPYGDVEAIAHDIALDALNRYATSLGVSS